MTIEGAGRFNDYSDHTIYQSTGTGAGTGVDLTGINDFYATGNQLTLRANHIDMHTESGLVNFDQALNASFSTTGNGPMTIKSDQNIYIESSRDLIFNADNIILLSEEVVDVIDNQAVQWVAEGKMTLSNENGGKIEVKAGDYYLYANYSDVDIIASDNITGVLQSVDMEAQDIHINTPYKALRVDSGGTNTLEANNIKLTTHSNEDYIVRSGDEGSIGYIEMQGSKSTDIGANNEIVFKARDNLVINDVYLDTSIPQTEFVNKDTLVQYSIQLEKRTSGTYGNLLSHGKAAEGSASEGYELENMGHVLTNLNALVYKDLNNYDEIPAPECIAALGKDKVSLQDCLESHAEKIKENYTATELANDAIKSLWIFLIY